MIELLRENHRYTAYFCEENIWWLARDLESGGVDVSRMNVLFISNPAQSVVLFNQCMARQGDPLAWDYHVVLQARIDNANWILDFDTCLDFASPQSDYLANTFPLQEDLPPQYRAWARIVPAASFLRRFHSDRSHMFGKVPESEFPDYPAICPPAGVKPIDLGRYRDMTTLLDDGSVVQPLAALFGGPQ